MSFCLSLTVSTTIADSRFPKHSKTTGQFQSIKGNIVETIGNLTGAQSWQQSGKEEHAKGEAEYDAARAKEYIEGTKDRVGSYKDSVVSAVTRDNVISMRIPVRLRLHIDLYRFSFVQVQIRWS